MNADGTSPRRLNQNRWYDDYPSWSPDGLQLAFASNRDSGDSHKLDIYVMNADGSNVRHVVADQGDDLQPTWSPDGKMLAFSSDRFGDRDIFIVNSDGTGVRRVVSSPCDDEHPHWIGNANTVNVVAMPTAVVRNQLGMELVYLPPGSFMMGSTNGDERPAHQVTIKEGFDMGRYEVTQGEWQQEMGSTVQQKRDPNILGTLCEQRLFPPTVGEGDRYPMYY
jgi:Tol biopolymer transport system component